MNIQSIQPAWDEFMGVLNVHNCYAYLTPANNSNEIHIAAASQYFQLAFDKLKSAPGQFNPVAVETFFKEVYAMTATLMNHMPAISNIIGDAYSAFVRAAQNFIPKNYYSSNWYSSNFDDSDDLLLAFLIGQNSDNIADLAIAATQADMSLQRQTFNIVLHNAPAVGQALAAKTSQLTHVAVNTGTASLSGIRGVTEQFNASMLTAIKGTSSNMSGMAKAPDSQLMGETKSLLHNGAAKTASMAHSAASAGQSCCEGFLNCLGGFCNGCCECLGECCEALAGRRL